MTVIMSLAFVALALTPLRALAQKGPMANVHLAGTSLKGESDDTIESGGGGGARFGWGITKHVTMFIGGDYAKIESEQPGLGGSYHLTQADVGFIYNFRVDKTLLPYFEGALTSRKIKGTFYDTTFVPTFEARKVDITSEGVAFTFGGGMNYYFTPIWAFNLGLNYSVGSFKDFDVDGQPADQTGFNASGARFHLGLTLYPMKK